MWMGTNNGIFSTINGQNFKTTVVFACMRIGIWFTYYYLRFRCGLGVVDGAGTPVDQKYFYC